MDEEGDPVSLAEARSLTFAHRRKVFLVSTPTIRGLSRIEREFEASDQRRYHVPCPHCGAMQWLKFERLRWDKGQPDTAEYHCEGCDTAIAEHHKTAMLEAGEWRATAEAADPGTVGYHLSALYSPVGWLSWPLSTSAFLTQSFRVRGVQPILAAIDITAFQRDACRPSLARTSRMARPRISGEYLFVVLLMMLHPAQELEPPANPVRFSRADTRLFVRSFR